MTDESGLSSDQYRARENASPDTYSSEMNTPRGKLDTYQPMIVTVYPSKPPRDPWGEDNESGSGSLSRTEGGTGRGNGGLSAGGEGRRNGDSGGSGKSALGPPDRGIPASPPAMGATSDYSNPALPVTYQSPTSTPLSERNEREREPGADRSRESSGGANRSPSREEMERYIEQRRQILTRRVAEWRSAENERKDRQIQLQTEQNNLNSALERTGRSFQSHHSHLTVFHSPLLHEEQGFAILPPLGFLAPRVLDSSKKIDQSIDPLQNPAELERRLNRFSQIARTLGDQSLQGIVQWHFDQLQQQYSNLSLATPKYDFTKIMVLNETLDISGLQTIGQRLLQIDDPESPVFDTVDERQHFLKKIEEGLAFITQGDPFAAAYSLDQAAKLIEQSPGGAKSIYPEDYLPVAASLIKLGFATVGRRLMNALGKTLFDLVGYLGDDTLARRLAQRGGRLVSGLAKAERAANPVATFKKLSPQAQDDLVKNSIRGGAEYNLANEVVETLGAEGLETKVQAKRWIRRSADEINRAQIAAGLEPSWKPGTYVFEVTLKTPVTVYRVHADLKGAARQWVMKTNPAALTRQELADRFGLPGGAESIRYVTEIKIPAGISLRGGIAGANKFGRGGGRQWLVHERKIDDQWIQSTRPYEEFLKLFVGEKNVTAPQ